MRKTLLFLSFFVISAIGYSQQIPKWKITDIEKMMQSGKEEILVLNFWATFCKPCVAEIPSFIKVTDKYKAEGVKLYLISFDLPSAYPKKIESFTKQRNYTAGIAWLQ